MISLDASVMQSPACLGAEVGAEMVVMSVERGLYYGFDDIGADIWSRISQQITVRDLCCSLVADYEAPLETIEGDVLATLETLADAGLIEVRE